MLPHPTTQLQPNDYNVDKTCLRCQTSLRSYHMALDPYPWSPLVLFLSRKFRQGFLLSLLLLLLLLLSSQLLVLGLRLEFDNISYECILYTLKLDNIIEHLKLQILLCYCNCFQFSFWLRFSWQIVRNASACCQAQLLGPVTKAEDELSPIFTVRLSAICHLHNEKG